MSAAGDFIDGALRYEGAEDRVESERARVGSALRFYGASVGAVRGTVRDVFRRYPDLTTDEVTALASELWSVPVFERRLAAVVALQSIVDRLDHLALTRIEGFLRQADTPHLIDPLVRDVAAPLLSSLSDEHRARADRVITRWSTDDRNLQRAAALLASLSPHSRR